jgi:hypothetical protein
VFFVISVQYFFKNLTSGGGEAVPGRDGGGLGLRPQRAAGARGRGPQGGDGAEDAGDGGAVEEGEGGGQSGLPAGEEEVRRPDRVLAEAGKIFINCTAKLGPLRSEYIALARE